MSAKSKGNYPVRVEICGGCKSVKRYCTCNRVEFSELGKIYKEHLEQVKHEKI